MAWTVRSASKVRTDRSVTWGQTNRQTVRTPGTIDRNAVSNRKVKRKVGTAKRKIGWLGSWEESVRWQGKGWQVHEKNWLPGVTRGYQRLPESGIGYPGYGTTTRVRKRRLGARARARARAGGRGEAWGALPPETLCPGDLALTSLVCRHGERPEGLPSGEVTTLARGHRAG